MKEVPRDATAITNQYFAISTKDLVPFHTIKSRVYTSDQTKVWDTKELSYDVSSSSSLKLLASAYSGSSSESSEEGDSEGFKSW